MEKKKILVIDDEEAFGQMVKISLEETGEYEVRLEIKGARAFAAAREFKPDLIFLDIVIPDVDGSDVALQIESDAGFKDVPIVFLTAAVMEPEMVSQAGTINGHPFIAKPVTTEKLIECINENIKK